MSFENRIAAKAAAEAAEAAAESAKQPELSKEERKAAQRADKGDDILRWFKFDQLPEPVRSVVEAYSNIANGIMTLPQCAERTVALRKLLESKDCAIRALMS